MMTPPSDQDRSPEILRGAWQERATCRLLLREDRTVLLRPLLPGDAGLMADFFAALSEREIYYFFSLDAAAARRLAERADGDPAMRLVALMEQDGRVGIVGYMFLDWADGTPPTFGACLREEAQSVGLGRAMMAHLLTLGRDAGMGRVRLTAHAENWRALRLYQRHGFRIVGETILERQGAKQYRMEANLQLPPPTILDNLTIVARGGIGIGMAAARIQAALEPLLGAVPLILDRPVHADGCAVVVADLAAGPEHPFQTPEPPFLHDAPGQGWVARLDQRTALVGGFGPVAVGRAADRYLEALRAHTPSAEGAASTSPAVGCLPLSGLCS